MITVKKLCALMAFFTLSLAMPDPTNSWLHGVCPEEKITFSNSQIESGLTTLETLKQASQAEGEKFREILLETKTGIYRSMLNGPDNGSIRLLWQCIRYDRLMGEARMGISTPMKYLDQQLAQKGAVVLNGGVAPIPNWGALYPFRNLGVVLKFPDSEYAFAMTWLYRNKRFQPARFLCSDNLGLKDIYEFNPQQQQFELAYSRRPLKFKQDENNLGGYPLVPMKINGPRTVPVLAKNQVYAFTVEEPMHILAYEPVFIVKDSAAPPENQSRFSSFVFTDHQPTPLNPTDKTAFFPSVTEKERETIRTMLMAAAIPEDKASMLCANCIKPGEPVTVAGSCFFKGSETDLKKGNYTVCGVNRWSNGDISAFMTIYKKGKPDYVSLEDGLFDRFDKKGFYLSMQSANPQRMYVGVYTPEGVIKNSTLHLSDLGAVMVFDDIGRLYPEYLHSLFMKQHRDSDKKPSNYFIRELSDHKFTFQPGQPGRFLVDSSPAFVLENAANQSQEYFTNLGKPMMGLDIEKEQMVVNFEDDCRDVTYLFPRYASADPERLTARRTLCKHTGVFHTDEQGVLHMQATKSSVYGTVLKTWVQTYPTKLKQ